MVEEGLDLDRVAPEAAPGIRLLPILHERVDMAAVVRAVLEALDPALVAVELPTTLAAAAAQAVARLPRISVVLSEEPGEDALVWAVTPGDPLVEGLRWAAERERPTALVDPDLRYELRHRDPVPDPHAMWAMGVEPYLGTVRRLAGDAPSSEADALRERGMAHHLLEAHSRAGSVVLALLGAAHVDRVASLLGRPTAPPLARRRRSRVEVRHLHPESMTALLPDPPLAHAVFEMLRGGEPPDEVRLEAAVSRRVELEVAGLRLITGAAPDERAERERALVGYAAGHAGRAAPWGGRALDRMALGRCLWRVASGSYEEQTRTATAPWQRRLFFDFSRRYARIQGLLAPGLFEWVVAGRGVADDNLAWELFDAARCYPWQAEAAELPTARVDGDLLDLGTRKVRFRRRFLKVKQRPVAIPVRRRGRGEEVGEWLRAFSGDSLCSYPPEDVTVEDYGRFLQQKAISNLSAQTSRSEPFTTSMLDGVDIRETVARWHEGRVWVHEKGRAPGEAGAVVVIFDEDREADEFPYLMTWLGEHEQESDMAFYATDPTRQIVGPGIMRATYGGFMLTYPPGRLFDVWRDPDYRSARSKPEVLLMAAVDYSRDRLVVHVATAPPSPRMHAYAAYQAKRIVHVPLGSLSPVTLRKVQVVHILAGRERRSIAKDYVW